MTTDAHDPLAGVPDWTDGTAAERWLAQSLRAVAALPSITTDDAFASTAGSTLGLPGPPGAIGRLGEERWRRFALATFAADLACYLTAEDRVGFDRLLYVLDGFPDGFRVWWRQHQGAWLPVGYAAWYPISSGSLGRLERGDPTLAERLIPPVRGAPAGAPVYIFNYSVDASSRRSALSRALLSTLAAELAAARPAALAAITVSPDGIRVAERFTMTQRATLVAGDLTEWVYIARRDS